VKSTLALTLSRIARGDLFFTPNALWTREMRQQARLNRTPWVLLALTLTISLFLCSMSGLTATHETSPAMLGAGLFQGFFSLAYFVVMLVGPAVAANSVASEREGRTWEAVLLAGLSPKVLTRGKFLAAYTTLALYVVVLAPVGALPFLFGGVTATEVVLAFVLLFAIAAITVLFGLAVSSLMASLRGALVVTLVLAVCVGPMLFGVFGVGGSLALHDYVDVPEGFPVWLPLALTRTPVSTSYGIFLVATPLAFLVLPAWFLYEITIANLAADADDRSTGLKTWFVVATPLVAAMACAPSLVSNSASQRFAFGIAGLTALFLHIAFCALLFADEPPGPSRRVRIRWQRRQTSALARFFGPGLVRTMSLVLAVGAACIAMLASALVLSIGAAVRTSETKEQMVAVLAFATYALLFVLFIIGFTAWVRGRGTSAWIVRIVTLAAVSFAAVVPVVAAAIGGELSPGHEEGFRFVGGPSPIFAFYMVSAFERDTGATATLAIGVACAFAWGAAGLALFVRSVQLAFRTQAATDEATQRSDAALAAEDAARAAAAQASTRVQSEHVEPSS
jgi:ABC-type transport system involved in multi-copper enzyme maturation permease subunit